MLYLVAVAEFSPAFYCSTNLLYSLYVIIILQRLCQNPKMVDNSWLYIEPNINNTPDTCNIFTFYLFAIQYGTRVLDLSPTQHPIIASK